MKKTLLALSVLAAGSAQAGINLYDANGVIVDLSGAAEIQYIQKIQDKNSDNDAGIRIDDGDLQLNTTIAVTDQLNVVSGIGFKFEAPLDLEGSKSNVSNDELWVGLGGDFGTLTFGRQLLISDDSGIGKDYELGTESIGFGRTEGNETIKYVFDNGQFYFGLSHDLDAEGNDFQGNDGTITDGRIGARFADFDVRAYYYTLEVGNGASKEETDAFNLEAEYVMGQFAFAASYGQVEEKAGGVTQLDADVISLAGSYTMGKNTFALGYNRLDDDADTADNVYANITHQLHSNVKVYGELGWADKDSADLDLGYLVGMEVIF
ncbi:porin [Photobacterium gaetbulicola]|uniref:Porin n=1 Tax=Photobacterium gaetbulicola TaxID=1295392 RepID=A0A0B9GYI8_9GAMM|nr:porin [Photobacterium gaetbulicola]KHT61697.1 porin [Photobacterium gaetbulicola]